MFWNKKKECDEKDPFVHKTCKYCGAILSRSEACSMSDCGICDAYFILVQKKKQKKEQTAFIKKRDAFLKKYYEKKL